MMSLSEALGASAEADYGTADAVPSRPDPASVARWLDAWGMEARTGDDLDELACVVAGAAGMIRTIPGQGSAPVSWEDWRLAVRVEASHRGIRVGRKRTDRAARGHPVSEHSQPRQHSSTPQQ